ncbi:2',3'-cyclic-nucleotide 3'-phosphodiesterase [Lineolata rhizophorae]|uniref:2',3'-cyclic-nucleotide 3'-phosphodiesterase n=1 Tax=Lineolata rhizophorae TaxID=578093 RepID=A0A6A6PAN2_9PEZI|nr:2',3'-cyclic-nucleotide 3'-phosphodiesterase [Lineolata rhizophorae]
MPGSSLWLLPPPSHPLHSRLTTLISTTCPSYFASASPRPPTFIPHVTLTSEIPTTASATLASSDADPQAWLDALPLPAADDVRVRFQALDTEDVFFRRLTVRVEKEGVRRLGTVARAWGVEGGGDRSWEKACKWADETWRPHCSLMYAGFTVTEERRKELECMVKDASISFDGEEDRGSWTGGLVVLVPTEKRIEDWKPVATRVLQ